MTRPSDAPGQLWHRAWINGVNNFHHVNPTDPFHIGQDHGEGIITFGTREWTDYRVIVPRLIVRLGSLACVAVRVQGLNRYYSLVFTDGNRVAIFKARDDKRTELVSAAFEWKLDAPYEVSITVQNNSIKGCIAGGPSLEATDDSYVGGGIGLLVANGAVSANQFNMLPVE